jgi:hypothetical protein
MRRGYPTGVTQVNQWLNPLKLQTDSNLVDVGRAATHAVGPLWADGDSKVGFVRRPRGHEEGLRRTRDEVAGEKLGANPVKQDTVNVGTIRDRPFHRTASAVAGTPAVG